MQDVFSVLVLLDLSAAFDTTDLQILMNQHEACAFQSGTVLRKVLFLYELKFHVTTGTPYFKNINID